MPEVRALRSFKGRYGHIRAGQTFTAEPNYAAQLKRNKLVVIVGGEGEKGKEPAPSKNRDKGNAPARGGKDQTGKDAPPTDPRAPAAGQTITSASVQAGQASRPKTLPLSGAGGRRGTPTARKPKGKTKTSSTPPGAGA